MHQKLFFSTLALLLTTVAVLHGLRALAGWEVIVDGWSVPIWISGVLFLFVGYLAFMAVWMRCDCKKKQCCKK